MAGGPMMGAPPVPKTKNNTILIVIVVIVVVLALVIAGTLLVINAFNHTVNQNTDITMTVDGTRTPSLSEYNVAPAAGDMYVQVTVSMTNNGNDIPMVSAFWFELEASGTTYSHTLSVTSDTSSTMMPVGGTITFKVSFEVPNSAVPHTIIYKPPLSQSVSATI